MNQKWAPWFILHFYYFLQLYAHQDLLRIKVKSTKIALIVANVLGNESRIIIKIFPLLNCLVAGSVRHVDVDQHHHQQEGGEGPVAEPHGPGQPQLGPVVLRGVRLLAAPVPGLHAPALPGQLLHQLLPHHPPLLQEAAVHDVTIQVSHLQS